jgi:hypothetical protein
VILLLLASVICAAITLALIAAIFRMDLAEEALPDIEVFDEE